MKNYFLALVLVGLICGCDQKPDPRIAQLEQRITVLENNLTALNTRTGQTNLFTGVYLVETNSDGMSATRLSFADMEVLLAKKKLVDAMTESEKIQSKQIDPNTGLPYGVFPSAKK
jgi:O-acetylhomoserine/O-acetylserine sulfhydrylase-like pyridoxal-dependent enzyme